MANDRKGTNALSGLREDDKKGNFGATSINNFRNKMLQEEKEESNIHVTHSHSIDRENAQEKAKAF